MVREISLVGKEGRGGLAARKVARDKNSPALLHKVFYSHYAHELAFLTNMNK
jgi:hypothetical protein